MPAMPGLGHGGWAAVTEARSESTPWGTNWLVSWSPVSAPSWARPWPVEPHYESGIYEVVAGNMVAVAPSPAALEPDKLIPRAGEQQHLQHTSNPEMPRGKEVVSTICSQEYLWTLLSPGSPGREPLSLGSSWPGADFPRTEQQGPMLAMSGVPRPSFPLVSSQFLSPFTTWKPSSFPYFHFSNQPETLQSSAIPVYSSV